MAQSASLAEAKATQARANLENYVFGTAVSTVPPVVSPMLPKGAANYPAYPYVSSPTQWQQGTPPIARAELGGNVVNSGVLLTALDNLSKRRAILQFL